MSPLRLRPLRRVSPFVTIASVAIVVGGLNIEPIESTARATNPVSPEQFCGIACTLRARCDENVSVPICFEECLGNEGLQIPHLRGDWTQFIVACLGLVPCPAWLGGTALASCVASANAAIVPTPTARLYCAFALAKDRACGAAALESEASCQETAKVVSDDSLEAAAQCLRYDCSVYVGCVLFATGVVD